MSETTHPTVVLVHGGFVDGSGWQAVYDELRRRDLNVRVVQNPTTSLTADVAATKDVIESQPGRVVLVGHSYGGVVVTEAGTHDRVAAVVYIAAFAPDKGESVNTLIADPPPGAPVPPILPPTNGFLFLDRDKFADSFAADVTPGLAQFMADSQVPWGVDALDRHGHRTCLAAQAELVPRRHRGPHDPTPGPASDGRAHRRHRHRNPRQPRRLRLPTERRRGPHRTGHPPVRHRLTQGPIPP